MTVSKTTPVYFHEEMIWAYDVALGMFLKHLIDAAEPHAALPGREWLSEAITDWRVVAQLGGGCFALAVEESWSPEQREFIINLADDACRQLGKRDSIETEEAQSWNVLDGQGVFTRGAERVETAPVIELGRAIIALAQGTLEKPPTNTRWFYGCPEGRLTIACDPKRNAE
jgi:hypothetical protein